MKKIDYLEVCKYIKDNSNCELISKEYKNIDEKIIIRCGCGKFFSTSFYKFKNRNKKQCNNCGAIKRKEKQTLSYETVKKYIELESGSGCKLLSQTYENAHKKLLIECKCGNEFETKLNHFKQSDQKQCKKCGIEIVTSQKRLSDKYIEKYIEKHNCKLASKYINSETKIKIKCGCGSYYETLFIMFRDYDIRSCKICREENKSISKGETKIEKWLIKNKVKYKRQYKIKGCKFERELPFDFAIIEDSKLKMLIEYDGKQHFELGGFTSDKERQKENLLTIQRNDLIKDTFCKTNNIKLLRVKYLQYKQLDNILSENLL